MLPLLNHGVVKNDLVPCLQPPIRLSLSTRSQLVCASECDDGSSECDEGSSIVLYGVVGN
jgi:hypothetical protein